MLTPGLIFAADGTAFAKAIAAAAPKDAEIVIRANPTEGATLFEDLLATTPTAAWCRGSEDAADDAMKIMFTSARPACRRA